MAIARTATPFREMLRHAQERNRSLLCVGLDPDPSRFPTGIARTPDSIVAFNRAIIDATSDLACCYKPNLGFYLPFGTTGVEALAQVRKDVPEHIPVLLDAKFGDIGITSVGYARAAFDTWRFNAVTVNPFLGHDALEPFLTHVDRGIFILAKTSNPGSCFLQDRTLRWDGEPDETVTMTVVRQARDWNSAGNVGLVVGATYPETIAEIRAVAADLPFLVPGVGAQAGELDTAVRAGLDADRAGLLVNASRAICYASAEADFADAARQVALELRDAINAARASTT